MFCSFQHKIECASMSFLQPYNRVGRCIIRGANPCTCRRSSETAQPKNQHSHNVTKQMYTINILFFDFLIWATLGQSGNPKETCFRTSQHSKI